LQYTQEVLALVKAQDASRYAKLISRINFDEREESDYWTEIIRNIHLPEDQKRGIFLQQDGFLDKPLLTVNELQPSDRPINQKWSWDRILRSCFIKQADVLQGLYFFEPDFTLDTVRRNFDFYEPMTVHESSLSPCVHVILASRLGYKEKAYELYLRTARLDLDDYNNDTEDGCHITSMAGTWMSIVKGFGGMRVKDGMIHFDPFIPEQWQSYSFRVEFREHVLKIEVSHSKISARLVAGNPLTITLCGKAVSLNSDKLVAELSNG
jgi:maltose phosphorylase